jgi:hypothetical protein
LVDIVVCAVADFTGSVPNTLRPLLYRAFRRAREVGLTTEEVEKALAPSRPPAGLPAKADDALLAEGEVEDARS